MLAGASSMARSQGSNSWPFRYDMNFSDAQQRIAQHFPMGIIERRYITIYLNYRTSKTYHIGVIPNRNGRLAALPALCIMKLVTAPTL
jgi:hypothetical protein